MGPAAGENETIVGVWPNPSIEAVPVKVVTVIVPVEPAAITAVMVVEDTILKDVTGIPPMVTAVVRSRLVPVRVTVVPADPPVGVKLLSVGTDLLLNI